MYNLKCRLAGRAEFRRTTPRFLAPPPRPTPSQICSFCKSATVYSVQSTVYSVKVLGKFCDIIYNFFQTSIKNASGISLRFVLQKCNDVVKKMLFIL